MTFVRSASTANNAAAGLAAATRHILPNGMTALVLRASSSPTVSVRGFLSVGAVYESTAQSGLASFTGAALIRGTQSRTFQQIVAETEERGCSVHAGGGLHTTGFGARALAEDLPLVLEILADMLLRPTFPLHEVEKLRNQFLMGLREDEQETRVQASRAIRSMLYPAQHPYGRLTSGTMATIQALSRDDLAAFHQQYHPSSAVLVIVGDVEPPVIVDEIERLFGDWKPSSVPPTLDWPPVAPLDGVQRQHIPMAGKVQSDIIWGVHGLKRSDPAYYAAMIGNVILGQLGIGGRLGENVRERQGMAYYVYSSLEADLEAGLWGAAAGVNPENVDQAITTILHEIEQFCQHGPTDEEIDDVRAYLTGSLALGLETNDGLAGALLTIEHYDLGLDYVMRYPEIIHAVSREAIVETARAYLSTERYAVAIAGPAEEE